MFDPGSGKPIPAIGNLRNHHKESFAVERAHLIPAKRQKCILDGLPAVLLPLPVQFVHFEINLQARPKLSVGICGTHIIAWGKGSSRGEGNLE